MTTIFKIESSKPAYFEDHPTKNYYTYYDEQSLGGFLSEQDYDFILGAINKAGK